MGNNQEKYPTDKAEMDDMVQSALAAKTKEIQALMREKKKFCEALDGVEQLWKNYEADLKAKEDQIDQNIKDMKEMNEIILKLREERRKKDLAAKNEIKEKKIILKYEMDNLKK